MREDFEKVETLRPCLRERANGGKSVSVFLAGKYFDAEEWEIYYG